jgi:hypothetical protein
MKNPTTPKIPRGWRRLQLGEQTKLGDVQVWGNREWPLKVCFWPVTPGETIIRRVAKRRAT